MLLVALALFSGNFTGYVAKHIRVVATETLERFLYRVPLETQVYLVAAIKGLAVDLLYCSLNHALPEVLLFDPDLVLLLALVAQVADHVLA